VCGGDGSRVCVVVVILGCGGVVVVSCVVIFGCRRRVKCPKTWLHIGTDCSGRCLVSKACVTVCVGVWAGQRRAGCSEPYTSSIVLLTLLGAAMFCWSLLALSVHYGTKKLSRRRDS
jgi:hypothetical protein